jgi:hypothetical protein
VDFGASCDIAAQGSTDLLQLARVADLVLSGRYARLQHEREDGRRMLRRGAVLLISAPLAVIAAIPITTMLSSFGPIIIASMYCIVGGSAGLVMAAVGAAQERSAARRLRELDQGGLPGARLLR